MKIHPTTTLAEINVTPLVDVTLVLLIIFMVTAPMMQQGIAVHLPQSERQNSGVDPEVSYVVTVAVGNLVYLNDRVIQMGNLEAALRRIYSDIYTKDIYLRGDKDVPYGQVVEVMDIMKRVGIRRIAIVTEPYEG